MKYRGRGKIVNCSKMPICPSQHLALQKGNVRTLILGWTTLFTLWYTYELRWLGACNHVTRALTGTTNYLNIHSRYLHQECGVLARGEGVYGTCDDSRSRIHTHYQQHNQRCISAEQYEAIAL